MKAFVKKYAMTLIVAIFSLSVMLIAMGSARATDPGCLALGSPVAVDNCHFEQIKQMDVEIAMFYKGDHPNIDALKKQGVVGQGRLRGRFMQNESLFRQAAVEFCDKDYACLHDVYVAEYTWIKERRATIRRGVIDRVAELKGNEKKPFLFHSDSEFMYTALGPSFPSVEPSWLVEKHRLEKEEAEWHAATAKAREENTSVWSRMKSKAKAMFSDDEPLDNEEFVGD